MSMIEIDEAQLREIWARVFNHVRAEVDVATVWLAMQAAVPIALDGPYFVAGFAVGNEYLATNLQGADATAAIEAGLLEVTGRVLAFRVIGGTTPADWLEQKSSVTGQAAPVSQTEATRPSPPPQPDTRQAAPPPRSSLPPVGQGVRSGSAAQRDVAPTWDKLTENLAHGYKSAAYTKYAPGQARYIMQAAQMISDTMDVILPDGGATPDEQGERQLMKVLERFGAIIQLDPLFIMLEVLRLRARQGYDI